jgi:quercetin dioxygenase-like cupin family protein
MPDGYRILSLADVEPTYAPQQEAKLLPVRRLLGFRAAGVNGWTGDRGERVVPPHEEDSGNEELYVVVCGRAAFTVGGEETDAPAGTFIHVQPETHRVATATEDGTIVVAIGGTPGQAFTVFGWDDWAVADALRREGRRDEARAALDDAIAANPEAGGLIYNAACWQALDGDADAAFELLRRAIALDEEEVRRWAAHDSDLDPLRTDPRFAELLG